MKSSIRCTASGSMGTAGEMALSLSLRPNELSEASAMPLVPLMADGSIEHSDGSMRLACRVDEMCRLPNMRWGMDEPQ